jgi:Helix-hairpin-helix motif
MRVSSLKNNPVQIPAVPMARLAEPHGYRFEGDTVHLNAMYAVLDASAHELSWAVQLWACPVAPVAGQDLAGHIVAEAALPPIGEIADECEHFEVGAFAWPPAGAGEHFMVLVLASGYPGQFNVVHDLAVYPARQRFIQPRIGGAVGYRIDGAQAQISVERIENPRPEGNLSGTLSLELWALSAPFEGGHFEGHHLAGVEIGSVNGQGELAPQSFDLGFIAPPPGEWQIVLMLREWTAEGFVTRDFATLDTHFVNSPMLDPAPVPVAEPGAAAATVAEESAAAVVADMPTEEVVKEVPPASAVKTPADASAGCVSVNTAPAAELAAVKGLSAKIAEGIVKKRPFSSLDELRRVKGLGTKLLAKVRSRLKL